MNSNWSYSLETLKSGKNWRLSRVTLKFGGWPWNTIGHLFYTTSSLGIISNPSVNSNFSYSPETLNSGENQQLLVPCDLEIRWMTLKSNRAPLLYHIELFASFQIHRWIQTRVTVRKRSNRVQIGNFLSHVTLKFDKWTWKTIGHTFFAVSSFVNHFIAIIKLKLELQSGNAQFGSKSTIVLAVWPLKFGGWPWKTIGHLS